MSPVGLVVHDVGDRLVADVVVDVRPRRRAGRRACTLAGFTTTSKMWPVAVPACVAYALYPENVTIAWFGFFGSTEIPLGKRVGVAGVSMRMKLTASRIAPRPRSSRRRGARAGFPPRASCVVRARGRARPRSCPLFEPHPCPGRSSCCSARAPPSGTQSPQLPVKSWSLVPNTPVVCSGRRGRPGRRRCPACARRGPSRRRSARRDDRILRHRRVERRELGPRRASGRPSSPTRSDRHRGSSCR